MTKVPRAKVSFLPHTAAVSMPQTGASHQSEFVHYEIKCKFHSFFICSYYPELTALLGNE